MVTVANPGNIVVPLSTILDQLQGKLSSAEIDALLFGIVSQRKQRVAPGDLITAELINQILADLADLNVRVAALQGQQQPPQGQGATIAALSPKGTTDDPVRIGTTLQVTGQNFGYSTGKTAVYFDGPFGRVEVTRAELLTGSSDTRLLLIVPNIPTITDAGMNLTLRVGNGIAPDSRSIFVQPVIIPTMGDLFLNWRADANPNPNPNPLQASSGGTVRSADFALKLETANLPGTITLSADITNTSVPVPAGLVNSIVFMNPGGGVIANKQVQMGSNDTHNIVARIPDLPASFAAQTFTLVVRAAAAGNIVTTFSRSFTVGAVVPASDPDIKPQRTGLVVFDPSGNVSTDPANGRLDGTTIKLKKNFKLGIIYNLVLTNTAAATYDLTVAAKAGTTLTGWTVQLENTPASVTGPNPGRLVQFSASPTGSTPSSAGTVVFRIKRQGATSDWFEEFGVELLP
jgi:hypothetical protein